MRWSSRAPAPGNRPRAGWSLFILAAALIGGLAAAELRHVPLLVVLLVPLVLGGLTVYGLARWPGRQVTPPQLPGPQLPGPQLPEPQLRGPQRPGPQTPAGPERSPGPGAAPPDQTQAQVWLQPVQPASATDAQWWHRADGPAPPPGRNARPTPTPDLASYLASTAIAQCPNCGAFGIEVRHTPGHTSWSFRCDSCDHRWSWRPGTPWPPVHVMPGRRNAPRPPAP
jgi:hypothetical protein